VGFVVDIAALERFLTITSVHLSSISLINQQSSSIIIIWGWYNNPVVASLIVGSVPLTPKRKKENVLCNIQ
jgi:hypothetical protein